MISKILIKTELNFFKLKLGKNIFNHRKCFAFHVVCYGIIKYHQKEKRYMLSKNVSVITKKKYLQKYFVYKYNANNLSKSIDC